MADFLGYPKKGVDNSCQFVEKSKISRKDKPSGSIFTRRKIDLFEQWLFIWEEEWLQKLDNHQLRIKAAL